MELGNHEAMNGCLRSYIKKSIAPVILINLI